MNDRKLSLVTDFYELTMSNGYFEIICKIQLPILIFF